MHFELCVRLTQSLAKSHASMLSPSAARLVMITANGWSLLPYCFAPTLQLPKNELL